MKTYIVFVHMKLTSGQENSIYKVSAASEESAVDNLVARAVIETQCVSFGKPVDLGGTYGEEKER